MNVRYCLLFVVIIMCSGIVTPLRMLGAESVPGSREYESQGYITPKIVKVGGYIFPPYVQEESGRFKGLALDFIDMLNAFQSTYRFEFVPTSSMRRYKDFLDRVYDLILFERLEWGWKNLPVDVSKVYASDCEVLVAKAQSGRTQAYFDDLTGKSLQVYLGYHYPFAGYNADPKYLLHTFHARTTVSHEANIRSILAGRADLAVVTRSYLEKYLRNHPASIPRLLISRRIEQGYSHTILVRKGIDPTIDEINTLIDRMESSGHISILLGKYGIDKTPSAAPREREEDVIWQDAPSPESVQTIVKVGGYHFPPYVEQVSDTFRGLTLDLLELMNAFQTTYRFVFVPTTLATRHKDFDEGAYDVAFFEQRQWGWQERAVASSREFLKDSEVYLTRWAPDRTQRHFECLAGKSLLGYVGNHYLMTYLETDAASSLRPCSMRVTASHADNIRAVVERRADIAIVTKSCAVRYLRNHPSLIPHVLISDKAVQEHRHTILARESLGSVLQDIMNMLSALEKAGFSSFLWSKYDLTPISEGP